MENINHEQFEEDTKEYNKYVHSTHLKLKHSFNTNMSFQKVKTFSEMFGYEVLWLEGIYFFVKPL